MSEPDATLTAPAEDLSHGAHDGGHAHPSDFKYVQIALILAVITGIEVAVYYIPSLEGLLVPILAVFSIAKFTIVAMWFMHLRFDHKIFRRFFVGGIVLALFCFIAVLSIFHVFTR